MFLTETKIVRLYAVSECPDDDGKFELMPFQWDEFNREFDENCLDDELNSLCEYLYDGARYFEITKELCGNDESIPIQIDGEVKFVIRDIVGKIDSDFDRSEYYIFVNKECTEYCWVVAEMQETVYSG